MNTQRLFAMSGLIGLLAMSACGDASPDAETSTEFFELAYERSGYEGSAIDQDAVGVLQEVNSDAAFRFFHKFRGEEPNFVFSPLSISRAFSSFVGGSEPEAIEALFGLDPQTSSAKAWKQLFHLATDRPGEDDDGDSRSEFMSSDIRWVDGDSGESFENPHFDRVHVMELSTKPEESRQAINGWIEDRSGGMLEDFLDPGMINSFTMAVTTNVVYFVGAWNTEFEDAELDFQTAGGPTDVAAFTGRLETRASASDEVTVVQVPYTTNYRHWIVMPHGDFDTFADGLDTERYRDLKAQVQQFDVTLTMPEFTVTSGPDLTAAIGQLREETGTVGGTLTGAIDEAFVHKAAIEVTKEGTKAAAATAIIEYSNSAPEPLPSLTATIDRPFIHVIEDGETGSILFMGEVTDPGA
jgi:serpin B